VGTLISEKLRPLAGRIVRGIRDKIPSGYILGRLDGGDGPVQLIRLHDILNSTAKLTFDELQSSPAKPVDYKNDRILLKDQSSGDENGIYTVNASGAPTRATDADADADVTSMMMVPVEEGTANAGTTWQLTTTGTITLDTTSLTFTSMSGGGLSHPQVLARGLMA
jgi:phage-related tail fiber protein